MSQYSIAQPSAIIPYIPGGSYAHTVTRMLNSTEQAICYAVYEATPRKPCIQYINCVLDHLTEYQKAGLSSGTQLLTLIPAALAALPSFGPDVNAALSMQGTGPAMRTGILLLGGFCGLFPTGKGLRAVRGVVEERLRRADSPTEEAASEHKGGDAEDVLREWDALDTDGRHGPLFSPTMRWILIGLSTLLGFAILYVAFFLGVLGIVTWICERQFLALGWIIARMSPALFEALSLKLLRVWLARTNTSVSGALEIILRILEVAVKALHGGMVIWGTAVLGSTVLIDGVPAMWSLVAITAMFGAMELCVFGVVMEKKARQSSRLTEASLNK